MLEIVVPRGIDQASHHRLRDAWIEAQIPCFVEQIGVVERRQFGQSVAPLGSDARRYHDRLPGSTNRRASNLDRRAGTGQVKPMTIIMHDLAGADADLRFSPYCWRTRFALAHKGLPVETIPWRFTEKEALAFSGQGRVPVVRDGDRVVFDSWSIAEYLEEICPMPALFGGAIGRAHALFINSWADAVMVGGIARLIVRDLLDVVDSKDKD